jgi:hypothetical protein
MLPVVLMLAWPRISRTTLCYAFRLGLPVGNACPWAPGNMCYN